MMHKYTMRGLQKL